jgi:hypothetical protein
LDNNNNTIAFGYECLSYIKNEGLESGHYFKKIQMKLYERETEIQANNSKKILPLKLVIQRVLEKLKDLAIGEIKINRPQIQNNNIKYVVPVPSFLDEFQKNIMMEACVNAGLIKEKDDKSLFFPLESEVIQYFFIFNKCIDQNLFEKCNNFMIYDLEESFEIKKLFFEDIIFKIFDCKDFNTYFKKCKEINNDAEDPRVLYNDWVELEHSIMDFIESTNIQKLKIMNIIQSI